MRNNVFKLDPVEDYFGSYDSIEIESEESEESEKAESEEAEIEEVESEGSSENEEVTTSENDSYNSYDYTSFLEDISIHEHFQSASFLAILIVLGIYMGLVKSHD